MDSQNKISLPYLHPALIGTIAYTFHSLNIKIGYCFCFKFIYFSQKYIGKHFLSVIQKDCEFIFFI